MAHFHDNSLIGASGQGGYQISRSLRFNSADSAYLNRTPASAGDRKTWTFSFWIKRTTLGTDQDILDVLSGSAGNPRGYIQFTASDTFDVQFNSSGSSWDTTVTTTAVFRDVSSWYHFVVALDATQGTASNRLKVYVNGSQITAFSSSTYPANTNQPINNNVEHRIGYAYNGVAAINGYLTEINFIDGQALTPSSFGETDTITGVWKPKKYTGTYGTNGFYLNFSDNSGTTSTTLGKDSSGNGNNWTPNNFSVTAGAGNDSLIDTPTPYADGGNNRGNYATLNPLDQYSGNLMNGNLEFAGTYAGQNGIGCRGTLAVPSSGKWYAEAANVTYSGSGNSCMLGFTSSNQSISTSGFAGTLTPWIGVDASVFNNSIRLSWNGVSGGTAHNTVLFASYASGDVINFAIDFGAGKFWVGKNGTWYNSGDPAAGTNPTSTFTAGTDPWRFWGEYVASSDNGNRSSVVANFGQRPFVYTPPSGFVALNTQNLPEPSIKKPSSYFDVKLYTGTNATQSITGLNFSPDLVWLKNRSGTNYHGLFDTVRGRAAGLSSNVTDAESTSSAGNDLASFDANGFTVGPVQNWGSTNTSSASIVAWCWDESATPGFDIVTYTGTGSNRTVSHSLGVAPSMMIVKNRDTSGTSWAVYTATTGATNYLRLNSTIASTSGSTFWNNTAPTSSVFSVGTDSDVNANGQNHVAYLWSEVAGFSKFGSYTGNGSTDGPFLHCGFRPAFVIFKSSSSGYDWFMFDNRRDPENVVDLALFPNSSSAESGGSTYMFDFTSNGIKIRNSQLNLNGSGNTYIFCAWAETPAKYSLAR
jgi:hypothetical protein